MSSQRGNVKKKKPPKHQNKLAFKNDRNDTSKLTKTLNSMTIGGVCDRCRETIEWKIKYKKYKPLTQPKKCTKCSQKTVKHAYHIICATCAQDGGVCGKCGSKKDAINPYAPTPSEQAAEDSKLEAELKAMSERKRRAFFRWQDQGFTDDDAHEISEKEAKNFEDKEEEEEEEEKDEDDPSESDGGDGDDADLSDSLVRNKYEDDDKSEECVGSDFSLSGAKEKECTNLVREERNEKQDSGKDV